MLVFAVLLFLFRLTAAHPPSKNIILLGVSGAGKSILGNTLLGREDVFEVGDGLDSCTTTISRREGFLFGVERTGIFVDVSDTGGLGDTENRDEQFVDGVAAHIRNLGGVDGVVHVHNACETRLSAQARKALAVSIATLTDAAGRKDLAARLSIVLTQCTDPVKRNLYEARLPVFLCEKHKVCNVPLFWYDDHKGTSYLEHLMSAVGVNSTSWRKQFESWVDALPSSPLKVPSESEREKLKREYREEIKRNEQKVKDLEERIARAEQARKTAMKQAADAKHALESQIFEAQQAQATTTMQVAKAQKELHSQDVEAEKVQILIMQAAKAQETLTKEIKELKRELRDVKNSRADARCFSPESTIIDKELGIITMKDITIGNEVATAEGWATVTTLLHWHPNQTSDALQIVHDEGSLTLSPNHMVFAATSEYGMAEAIPAKQVEAGQMWLRVGGRGRESRGSLVRSVQVTSMDGYYAPLTSSGTILVDNVAASCHSQHDTYQLSHWMINALASPLRFISPWPLSYVPTMGDRHPCVDFPLKVLDLIF